MIKVILWDIDGTLLDFKIAEKTAFSQCFEKFGLKGFSDEMLQRYSKINHSYWEKLERNEITKNEVLVGRYVEFFFKEYQLAKEGKSTLCIPEEIINIGRENVQNKSDAKANTSDLDDFKRKNDQDILQQKLRELAIAFNDEYQLRLGDTAVYSPYGEQLVKDCRGKIKQYIVTNGTATAQHRKLKTSGLENIVDGWFISDEIGIEKPNIGFFDAVWKEIGNYQKNEVIIVGDSLTSDIRGGNNAGIITCWFNPDKKANTNGEHVDYEITSLRELYKILDEI